MSHGNSGEAFAKDSLQKRLCEELFAVYGDGMSEAERRPDGPRHDEEVAVLDAKGLRALAHPVRVQLVGLLRKYGPSTATRLAERLGVNSGTASYHLRQLGAAGFVEEDAELGNARERWWRSVHRTTRLSDPALTRSEPEATLGYLQSVGAAYTLRTQQALNELPALPEAWRGTFDMSDWDLRLTPAEAVALRQELAEVVARYRQDTPEAAADAPADAERVSLITQVLPELAAPAAAPPTPPEPVRAEPVRPEPARPAAEPANEPTTDPANDPANQDAAQPAANEPTQQPGTKGSTPS